MPRIDASKGRTVSPRSDFSGSVTTANAFTGIAEVLKVPAAIVGAQEEKADRLALVNLRAQVNDEFTRQYQTAADGYDGSNGGFADGLVTAYDEQVKTIIEQQPKRRRDQARLLLADVRNRQVSTARTFEHDKRNEFLVRGNLEWLQRAQNAIASDPTGYGDFRRDIDIAVSALPEGAQAQARARYRGALAGAFGNAMLDEDPHELLDILNSGDLDDDLDGNDKANLLRAATREIEHRQRDAELAARRRQAELRAEVKAEVEDVDQILETFGRVPDDRLARLQALAGQAGDPALAAEITEKVLAATEAATIAALPPKEGQDRVNALKGDETVRASAAGARLVEAAQKAVNAKRARLDQDPVAAGIDEGRIAPLSPDALSIDVLNQRAAQARTYAAENGISPQILSQNEREDFADYLANDPNGFTVATGIAGTRGGDAVLREVFAKQPTLVHLSGLAANGADRAFVRDARAGILARNEKGFKSLVPKAQGREAARDIIGAAAVLDPDFAAAVIDSVNAAYEVRGPARNVDPENLDTDLYRRLINEAVGATFGPRGEQRGGLTGIDTAFGDQVVIVPSWMRADRFEKVFHTLSDDHLARASGGQEPVTIGGEPITSSQLRRMIPVPAGNGRYRLRYGPEAYVFDARTGDDYELDLNRLRGEVE